MAIFPIFKSKSKSKSNNSKTNKSALVAAETASSSMPSVEESETVPITAAVTNDPTWVGAAQVFNGRQKFKNSVKNDNTIEMNIKNNCSGNIDSTITGDTVNIAVPVGGQGYGSQLQPIPLLFSTDGATIPGLMRNNLTIGLNGQVRTIDLPNDCNMPPLELAVESDLPPTSAGDDAAAMMEQRMRAKGISEPIIQHMVYGIRLRAQMQGLHSAEASGS